MDLPSVVLKHGWLGSLQTQMEVYWWENHRTKWSEMVGWDESGPGSGRKPSSFGFYHLSLNRTKHYGKLPIYR
jgi:hypothetical protein